MSVFVPRARENPSLSSQEAFNTHSNLDNLSPLYLSDAFSSTVNLDELQVALLFAFIIRVCGKKGKNFHIVPKFIAKIKTNKASCYKH